MKKKLLMNVAIVIVLLAVAFGVYWKFGSTSEKAIHYHAGFQVYVDGKLQNFSDVQYMEIKPCGGILHRENDQIEKAHLHDNVGDVVHVHRENALWGDLFKNINWEIPQGKEFVGYLNGERREDLLNYPILPYDSVVFFSGSISDMNAKLQGRVTDVHIKEVEQKSENCGNETK